MSSNLSNCITPPIYSVDRSHLSVEGGIREAAARFNLSSESTVYQWVYCFQSPDANALLNLRKRRSKLDKDIALSPISADIPIEQLTEEQKLAEIRLLIARIDSIP